MTCTMPNNTDGLPATMGPLWPVTSKHSDFDAACNEIETAPTKNELSTYYAILSWSYLINLPSTCIIASTPHGAMHLFHENIFTALTNIWMNQCKELNLELTTVSEVDWTIISNTSLLLIELSPPFSVVQCLILIQTDLSRL